MDLALSGHVMRVSTKVVDALCERCFHSGKCMYDAYDSFTCGSNAACDLGCPGYCELLAHLESLQDGKGVPPCDSTSF